MSGTERSLHMNEMAQLYVDTAKKYGHSAILYIRIPGTSIIPNGFWN